MSRAAYTVSVAQSNRGAYHIARIAELDLKPICRNRPPQRERWNTSDEAPDLAEMVRKWENTIHPGLRCTACTSEARRQLASEENGRFLTEGEGLAVGPGPEDRGDTS
jgi:hypothetical protein